MNLTDLLTGYSGGAECIEYEGEFYEMKEGGLALHCIAYSLINDIIKQ